MRSGSGRLQAHNDYEGCVGIQCEVWRHTDLDITPVHQFCVSVRTGAILLGAVGKTYLDDFYGRRPALMLDV